MKQVRFVHNCTGDKFWAFYRGNTRALKECRVDNVKEIFELAKISGKILGTSEFECVDGFVDDNDKFVSFE